MVHFVWFVVCVVVGLTCYFVGENRGNAAVEAERAKIYEAKRQIEAYGEKLEGEAKAKFSEWFSLLKEWVF